MAHLELGRRVALEVGRRLDIDAFNLTLLELVAVAEGRMLPDVAASRAAWRGVQLERHAAVTAPEVIVEHGGHGQAARADPEAPVAGSAADGWRGTVVGSGLAQGSAHVARNPLEALNMAAGAILVAPSTDPSWTPVFLKAGGLVMETGGYMSHGAIVAREFGIPAVVNLPGILQQVRTGDRLEVDGQRGTVRRLPAPTARGPARKTPGPAVHG